MTTQAQPAVDAQVLQQFMFYSASTMLCTANAVSQGGDPALGAQAGEARIREVFEKAGFTRFRRATETPFNLVLEARP